jgi:hypothetical protein
MSIKSRRFHIFESLPASDIFYNYRRRLIPLSGNYVAFLAEFGLAKLFADHRDAPVVSVYPLKEFRRHSCKDGKSYVGFGFRANQSVYFDEDVIVAGGISRVFTVSSRSAREICPEFSVWIRDAYDWAKSKYSPSRWHKIVTGPSEFTLEESAVVEARQSFRWAHVGFSENGDAMFEIENGSSRELPYLTIGIRDKQGSVLVGAVWLSVAHIKPGEKEVVAKDCYKDKISADELDPFDLPEPIPEKRDMYWEFGSPR